MTKLPANTKTRKPKNKVKTPMKKKRSDIQKHHKEYPRSYRFDAEVMETLKETLFRVNAVSPKKISESRLVKALIVLSQAMDEETLIRGLKQVL